LQGRIGYDRSYAIRFGDALIFSEMSRRRPTTRQHIREEFAMRGTLLIAATIVVAAATVRFAAAAPITPPSASNDAGMLQLVTTVCGRNGCAAVQTKKVVHTKPGSVASKHI
jgi:hypothetical protein